MDITSEYIYKLIKDEGLDISYIQLIDKILETKSRFRDFGIIGRTTRVVEGRPRIVYTMTIQQAIMIVTGLSERSMVWLIRELIHLEKSNHIKHGDRISERVITDSYTYAFENDYKDITKVLAQQSATMHMVDATQRILITAMSDGENRGTVTIDALANMLSESTGKYVDKRIALSLIIKHTGASYKYNVTTKKTTTSVSLPWLSSYLDDIMRDLINEVQLDVTLEGEIDRIITRK